MTNCHYVSESLVKPWEVAPGELRYYDFLQGKIRRGRSVITVHHLNNSRSQKILWLLEELGLPYEIKRYERDPTSAHSWSCI